MRYLLILLLVFSIMLPVSAKPKKHDKAVDASIIYDEILDGKNYKFVPYNYPAGHRELNLHGLSLKGQYNINAVVAPDGANLVYSEVYFFPDPRVTASALYIIPLSPDLSKKESVLSISTKDKIQQPIIETNYSKLYPFKFNTFTPVDWNKSSDKLLFKEKLGQQYDQIHSTKIYVYDMTTENLYDLNKIRNKIVDYWINQGVFLNDYKWDIKPLGFLQSNQNKVIVSAYGYYKTQRRFLGVWAIDVKGTEPYLISLNENFKINIAANGECLKFIPDIKDIYTRQKNYDRRHQKKELTAE